MSFAHLHIHSHYSLGESIVKIPELFARAAKLRLSGLALTDSSRMGGIAEFLSVAKDYPSIKPVVGCSFRLVDDGASRKGEPAWYDVVLLAKNLTGYHHLMKLSSIACASGLNETNPISRRDLEAHCEGLICLSGGLFGEVSQALMAAGKDRAREVALWYKSLFEEDFYFEVSLHKRPRQFYIGDFAKQKYVNGYVDSLYKLERIQLESMNDLAQELGIKLVATNPVHFLEKEDALAYDALFSYRHGKDVFDTADPQITRLEYLRSKEEMRSLFSHCPEAIANTMEVLSKIERYDIHSPISLSVVSENPAQELRETVLKGAETRYGFLTEEIKGKIESELGYIAKTNSEPYFLLVKELVDWAKAHHCIVGPGRSRAVSSVVNYCLGITDVDPIRHGLLSERFFFSDRMTLPDIDLDINEEGLPSVIDHLARKCGRECVSYMAVYGRNSASRAFEIAASAYRLPKRQVEKVQKRIRYCSDTIEKLLSYDSRFQKYYESGTEEFREACDCAKKLDGVINQMGLHACGFLVSDGDLTDKLPMMSGVDYQYEGLGSVSQYEGISSASQYDGHWAEDAGVLKIDLLGLKWLDFIRDVENAVSQKYGVSIDARKAPLDDAETFALFQGGDTKGVFLFEGTVIREWLQEFRPDRFSDLVALNALYRPGPMDNFELFCALKNGRETMVYDFPEEKEILAETYGLIVYQEQVMLLAQKICGLSPDLSSQIQLYAKRYGHISDNYDFLKESFLKGGLKKGCREDALYRLWRKIEMYNLYAFLKAHAVSYTWIAYQTAWLKAHYREEFMKEYERFSRI